MRPLRHRTLLTLVLIATISFLTGQAAAFAQDDDPNVTVDPRLYDGMEYRSLNFTRGGRAVMGPE